MNLKNGLNDDEIIKHYLSKCEVKVNEYINILPPGGGLMGVKEFKKNTQYFFNSIYSENRFKKWYKKALKDEIIDIFTYLKGCKINLGRTNWYITSKDGFKVTEDKMVEMFESIYSKTFIIQYFKEWKEDKMIGETEKVMGNFI